MEKVRNLAYYVCTKGLLDLIYLRLKTSFKSGMHLSLLPHSGRLK